MKIRKKICSLLLVCLAFLGIFCGRANVYADQKQALSATVTLLKQEKDCVVQVEAKNSGADFSGKVRLVFSGTDNSGGCAFEQCLTLPQNGKKQYTMTIPYADVSQTRGNGIVAFVDEKGNVVASEAFASIFGKEKRGIGVGVLSDHYDALGWMSMSGQTYYLHGKDQNVYLTQMDADTLQAQLDELYFLVIDSYDVSSLGKEKIKAIEKWVKNGGWLLIGTATSGKIGKYRIDDYLITGSGSTCTGMGGTHAFWAGSDSSNDAPFRVGYDGKLYASDANISGIINSTDGSIGGWKIEKNKIYSKSTDGLKQTSLNSDSQKIEFKLTRSASTESDESSSFLNISNSDLSPYIELGWMTTDSDGNAYWGNRNYISEDSISISSKADIDSSVTISSNDIILSDTGDKLTISPGYLQFENGVSISPNQDTLWSGADYMNENQTISLNGYKNISKQLSGICLAFTYYDRSNNSVQWYGMHYYFVPKSAVATNNGGGTAFTDPYRGINKYLYIYNDKILGTKTNGEHGSENGFSYDNRNWILVRVFGV